MELLFSPGIVGLVVAMFSIIMLISLSAWFTDREAVPPKRKPMRRAAKNLIKHNK